MSQSDFRARTRGFLGKEALPPCPGLWWLWQVWGEWAEPPF